MCWDVMCAVMDLFMWINTVYIVKSVVPFCSIDKPHMYSYGIDMPNSLTHNMANRDQISVPGANTYLYLLHFWHQMWGWSLNLI